MNPIVLIPKEEKIRADLLIKCCMRKPVNLIADIKSYKCNYEDDDLKVKTDRAPFESEESDESDETSSSARTRWWRWHRIGTLQSGRKIIHSIRSRDNRMLLVEPCEPPRKRRCEAPRLLQKAKATDGQNSTTQHNLSVSCIKKDPWTCEVKPVNKVETPAHSNVTKIGVHQKPPDERCMEDSPKFFCSRTSMWQLRSAEQSSTTEPFVLIASSDIAAAAKYVSESNESPAEGKLASLSKFSTLLIQTTRENSSSGHHHASDNQLPNLKLKKFANILLKCFKHSRTSSINSEQSAARTVTLYESISSASFISSNLKSSDIASVGTSLPDPLLQPAKNARATQSSSGSEELLTKELKIEFVLPPSATKQDTSSKPLLSYTDLLQTYVVEDGVQPKLGQRPQVDSSEHSVVSDGPEIVRDDRSSLDSESIASEHEVEAATNHLHIASVYSLHNMLPWSETAQANKDVKVEVPDEDLGPVVTIRQSALKTGKVLLKVTTSFLCPPYIESQPLSLPSHESVSVAATQKQTMSNKFSVPTVAIKKEITDKSSDVTVVHSSDALVARHKPEVTLTKFGASQPDLGSEHNSQAPYVDLANINLEVLQNAVNDNVRHPSHHSNSSKVLSQAVTSQPLPPSSLTPSVCHTDNSRIDEGFTVHNLPVTFQQVPADSDSPTVKNRGTSLLTNNSSTWPLQVTSGHFVSASVNPLIESRDTSPQPLSAITVPANTLGSRNERGMISSAIINSCESQPELESAAPSVCSSNVPVLSAMQTESSHLNQYVVKEQSIVYSSSFISHTEHLSEKVSVSVPVQNNSAVYPTVAQVPPSSCAYSPSKEQNDGHLTSITRMINPHTVAGPVGSIVQPTTLTHSEKKNPVKAQVQASYYAVSCNSGTSNTSQSNPTTTGIMLSKNTYVPNPDYKTSSLKPSSGTGNVMMTMNELSTDGYNICGNAQPSGRMHPSWVENNITPVKSRNYEYNNRPSSHNVGRVVNSYSSESATRPVSPTKTKTANSQYSVTQTVSSDQANSCALVWQGNVIGNESVISLPPRSVNTLMLRRKQSGDEIEPRTIGSSNLVSDPHITRRLSQENIGNIGNTPQLISSRIGQLENRSACQLLNVEFLRNYFKKYRRYPEFIQYLRMFFRDPGGLNNGEVTSNHPQDSTPVSKNSTSVDHTFLHAPHRTVTTGPGTMPVTMTSGKYQQMNSSTVGFFQPPPPEFYPNDKRVNQEVILPTSTSAPKFPESQTSSTISQSVFVGLRQYVSNMPNATNVASAPKFQCNSSETAVREESVHHGVEYVVQPQSVVQQICNDASPTQSGERQTIPKYKTRSSSADNCKGDDELSKRLQQRATERVNVTAVNKSEEAALPCHKQRLGILQSGTSPSVSLQVSTTPHSEPLQVSRVMYSVPLQVSTTTYSTPVEASTQPSSVNLQTVTSVSSTHQPATTSTSSSRFLTFVTSPLELKKLLNSTCPQPSQNTTKTTFAEQQVLVVKSSASRQTEPHSLCTQASAAASSVVQHSTTMSSSDPNLASLESSTCYPRPVSAGDTPKESVQQSICMNEVVNLTLPSVTSADSKLNEGSESLLVCVGCKVTFRSLARFNHHMEYFHGQTEKQQKEMCDRVKTANVPALTETSTPSVAGTSRDSSLILSVINLKKDDCTSSLVAQDDDSDEDLKSYLY